MDHVRIDEGVKRGPRIPLPPRNQRDPETKRFLPVLPADLDDALIFSRLRNGERIVNIAREYGVTPEAFYTRYQGNQEYLAAREIGTDLRLDQKEDDIEVAPDPLSLTRAREGFNAAFRRAQVEFPRRWGIQQHITIELTGDLGDRLRRARERVIDGEVVASMPTAANAALRLAHNASESQDGET